MSGDVYSFLNKLTLTKIFNFFLVRISYLLSVLLKRPVVWGLPYFITIEPSGACNLSCPQCPVGRGDISRDNKFMDDSIYTSIIDQIKKRSMMVSLNFQGEPLMKENFHEWVMYAANSGLYTMTSTNGQLLSEEVASGLVDSGLNRIIVSVDGTDQETYGRYRVGGRLDKVANGVKALSDARLAAGRKKPLIIIQFLVFRYNMHQISRIKELGKTWGADRILLKSVQIEYPGQAEALVPHGTRYSRYEEINGELVLKRPLANRCRRIWQTAVITSDAVSVPCCFDKKARYPLGVVTESNLSEIWKNTAYREFRQKLLRDRKKYPICMNCTEGQGGI